MSELGLSEVAPEAPSAAPARGRPSKRDRSLSRRMGAAGAALLGVMVALALLAPVLARHDPLSPSGRPFEAPSVSHPLGTNDVGQDLFAQLLHGSRISLTIGVVSALVAVVIGLGIALLAGYHRGPIDAVLMRVVDLTLAFPFLVLVIVLAAFFGRSLLTTVVVIAAVIWARPARVLRSQVIKVREFHHVVAARAMGASPSRIIGRHILPRVAPLAAAQFVRAANISVLIEASLAFLGLGDATRVSWGTMLYFANSRNAILTDAWVWWIVPPGLALTTAVLGFAFLGYAIEEWADPRLSRSTIRRVTRRRRRPLAVATAGEELPPGRVLQVRDLAVHYNTPAGAVRAVDGVSLEVGQGEILGLVGESGSGKSTIALALMGLARRPARVVSGSMVLNGRELVGLPQPQLARIRGRQVALVPQSSLNALNPAYTVHRQVAEAATLTRPEPQEASSRAHELLELVGIPRHRHGAFPHELSGGMRQRVVIAMAVANEPSLLIADEPVTGLDVVTQARIVRLLLDLRDHFGLAILLISHDLPLVARVADQLQVMYGGRFVETGPTTAVTSNARHPYTRQLLGAFPTVRGPRRQLVAIRGEPPDPLQLPSGCPFHPRCPAVLPECREAELSLEERVPGHRAACLLEDHG